jgi:hypothetical protein
MARLMPGVVAAPGLRETADIWFDSGRDPVVRWDDSGCRFELCDPGDDGQRLLLLQTARPVADPERVAGVLAEGLAACDFPPTEQGASRTHVLAALRAAGLDPTEFVDCDSS